ncbi:MAG TPA: ATP-binding cassette domain-containing protein, partial [Gemmatimonadaceae bacterium]|nr:ATP-binding cassette domain-containing protein [Gemmatimonadaceae bacterium]
RALGAAVELHRGTDGALSAGVRGGSVGGGATAAGSPPALALEGVSKRFGATVALHDVTLHVRAGTVHALLGENGAGKSTLVNVAFGHVRPDAGRVLVDGREHRIASPFVAMSAGLGMVHQHFALVPAMTVAENVALGRRGRHDLRRVAGEIARVGEETGLRVEPRAVVGELGVAAQQRVEIVKALVRGARVLMLDEPTAVLAPTEAEELLAWVRRYVARGGAAVLITHKLHEALGVADEVTVLRRGERTLHGPAAEMSETELLAAMLGEGAGGPPRDEDAAATPDERNRSVAARGGPARAREDGGTTIRAHETEPPARDTSSSGARPAVLRLERVSHRDERGVLRLRDVSLTVHAGELLGVAAVEGAGHHELLRILAGRIVPSAGHAELPDEVGFVSEDRHRDALAVDLSLTENVALRGAGRRRGRMDWRAEAERTARIVREHEVRAAGVDVAARSLSGGNQQKLVLGRELWGEPRALVAESPTRGLDVRASAAVLARLRAAAARGAAVVVYSSDLDELLALADRIVAVHDGRVREAVRTREAVGAAMVGVER